jgi:hypothetical protein
MEYGEKHSKTWKRRNAHLKTWSISRKLKIMENEKNKLKDVKYGEKYRKTGKMRNTHCRTWIMSRNSENHGK